MHEAAVRRVALEVLGMGGDPGWLWVRLSVRKQLETRLKEIETFWAHLAPLLRCYVRGPKGDSRRRDREDDECEWIRPFLRPPDLCRKRNVHRTVFPAIARSRSRPDSDRQERP